MTLNKAYGDVSVIDSIAKNEGKNETRPSNFENDEEQRKDTFFKMLPRITQSWQTLMLFWSLHEVSLIMLSIFWNGEKAVVQLKRDDPMENLMFWVINDTKTERDEHIALKKFEVISLMS